MLSKKKITKLLNAEFRKHILTSVNWNSRLKDKKIAQYARYVVDSQIVHRSKKYENCKEAQYGFSPIYPLCAVLEDGSLDTKFLEFNIINHFLKLQDGNSAVEVVMCILLEWCKEDKRIKSFDVDIIDKEMAKIEKAYIAEQKKQKANTNSKSQEEDNNI